MPNDAVLIPLFTIPFVSHGEDRFNREKSGNSRPLHHDPAHGLINRGTGFCMLSGSIKGRAEQRQRRGEGSQDTDEDRGFLGPNTRGENWSRTHRKTQKTEEQQSIIRRKKNERRRQRTRARKQRE
jgi:hypothetical protein